MKSKILLAALLMILSTTEGFSQSPLSEEQKQELKARSDSFRVKLNLTDEQSQKMDEINREYYEGLAGLRNSSGSKLQKYKKLKKLNAKRDTQVKSILDAGQYELYKKEVAEMKKTIKEKRK